MPLVTVYGIHFESAHLDLLDLTRKIQFAIASVPAMKITKPEEKTRVYFPQDLLRREKSKVTVEIRIKSKPERTEEVKHQVAEAVKTVLDDFIWIDAPEVCVFETPIFV